MSVRVASTINMNFTSCPWPSVLLFRGRDSEGAPGRGNRGSSPSPTPSTAGHPLALTEALPLPRAQASSETCSTLAVSPASVDIPAPWEGGSWGSPRVTSTGREQQGGGGGRLTHGYLSASPLEEKIVPRGCDCPCPGEGEHLTPSPLQSISPAVAELEGKIHLSTPSHTTFI